MSRVYNTPSIKKEYCVMGIYSAPFAWGWTSQAWDPSLYERSAVHTLITSYTLPWHKPKVEIIPLELFHIFLLKYNLVPQFFRELLIWSVQLFHIHRSMQWNKSRDHLIGIVCPGSLCGLVLQSLFLLY